MPKVRGDIPNLINGVSQQAPNLRLPTQGEVQENAYPLIVDGLVQRPPSIYSGTLASNYPDDTFFHTILRDSVEKYVVAITTAGAVSVYELDGTQKSVTNATSYLSGITNAREDLEALTVADHTFIINKKKTVAAGSSTAAGRNPEALIFVKSGQYGQTYEIFIDGVSRASYTTPDGGDASHSAYIDTKYIAEQLRLALVASGYNSGNWRVYRYSYVITLVNVNGDDFDIRGEDGYGGSGMKVVKDTTAKFSDLPTIAYEGFTVKMVGDDGSNVDDYWIEFAPSAGTGSEGVWREVVEPGARLGLDATTMPHLLIRNGDGTFTMQAATWTGRTTGNPDRTPDPSFVGQTIRGVTYHQNRLGFLTGENIVLSEVGQYYNFYQTTLLALLDTDHIDVAATHTKVSYLRHAVPFKDVLILFSDKTQFRLTGNDLLTPKTVNAEPLTELSFNPSCPPVAAQNVIFFTSDGEDYSQLYEFYVDRAIEEAQSESVSAQCPQYVPGGVDKIANSPDENLVMVYSTNDTNGIYVYKYYIADNEKLQSAWGKWVLPGVDFIGDMVVDKTELILTVKRGSSWHIEKINLEPGQNEKVFLDMRQISPVGVYNAGTDKTTFTFPVALQSGVKCVTTQKDGTHPLGIELTPDSISGTDVVLNGDKSGYEFYCGLEFDYTYQFSEFFNRQSRGRTQVAVTDGRLTVYNLSINYANTSYFTVEVEPDGRMTRTYKFSAPRVTDPDTMTGVLVQDDGRFAVPIRSRADRVKITVKNPTWRPVTLTNAQWHGFFNPYSRER
jgi:hypothetical protein